ncbi:MAG: prenyltransferase [Thermodesulfobacteriota bacterium]|nr:prenyltransferase [Thermodesulfobacteriota bacterium]
MKNEALFGPMRLPFLVLTPACVLLGVAAAWYSGGSMDLSNMNVLDIILVFAGALSAHISVNALNEYEDFKSGLDFKTKPTPFSGGSQALVHNPDNAHIAWITGVFTLCLCAAIGLYFIYRIGWGIAPVGIAGLLLVVFYTGWATRHPLVCLIAPGLGFGPLMVMGTAYVLCGAYTMSAFAVSWVVFFLVSNLLLLNQFPDMEPDREAGRRHLPIVTGRQKSARIYAIFLLCAYLPVIAGCIAGILPLWSLICLATLVIGLPLIRGVLQNAEDMPGLIPWMSRNVVLDLLTPILLAIGLFIGTAA